MEKKYTVTLRLSYQQYAWLSALCRQSKQTQSEVIRSLIEKYCAFMPYNIYLGFTGKDDKPLNDTQPLYLKNPKDCTEDEYKAIPERLEKACEIIKSFCLAGLDITMNQFNHKK